MVRPEHTAHLASPVGRGARRCLRRRAQPPARAARLPAGLEVVEGAGHVVGREGEEEGGHGVGAGLGVALDPLGRELVEVRADRDAQLGPAAPGRLELVVERGQARRQLLGRAVEGVPALPVARRPAQGGRRLAADVDGGRLLHGLGEHLAGGQVVDLAVEGGRVVDPERAQHLEVLVGPPAPALPGHVERRRTPP